MVTVILERPKYVQNLGAAIRACACFGVSRLVWTGDRIDLDTGDRLPRELRMKAYQSVEVIRSNRPFDLVDSNTRPVCVELLPGAMALHTIQHPVNAAYLFGPEDGDVSQVLRRFCHSFVYIPSAHCLNLAATVNVVLYDRQHKELS